MTQENPAQAPIPRVKSEMSQSPWFQDQWAFKEQLNYRNWFYGGPYLEQDLGTLEHDSANLTVTKAYHNP